MKLPFTYTFYKGERPGGDRCGPQPQARDTRIGQPSRETRGTNDPSTEHSRQPLNLGRFQSS